VDYSKGNRVRKSDFVRKIARKARKETKVSF